VKLGPGCLGHWSHRADPMPPRITRKSYRPRVSDRTMVGTLQPSCLLVSSTEWRRHHRRMKPLGWKKQIDLPHHATSPISGAQGQNKSSLHYVGWNSENFRPQEKYFFLTSPFIELHRTWRELALRLFTRSHRKPEEEHSNGAARRVPTQRTWPPSAANTKNYSGEGEPASPSKNPKEHWVVIRETMNR
jgi:hypothetical protein